MMVENNLTLVSPSDKPEIVAFYNQALQLKQYAESRVILTNDDLAPATNDLAIISKVSKGMESCRKEYLAPFQAHVKETNNAYKILMEPIEQADTITRFKMTTFINEQNRKRFEAEKIEAEKIALAKREAELKGGEFTVDLTPIDKPEAAPIKVNTDMGSAGTRDNWKWEVVDFSQVPDTYKMINAGVITPIVKASKGLIIIPGIRIYSEKILAVTAR